MLLRSLRSGRAHWPKAPGRAFAAASDDDDSCDDDDDDDDDGDDEEEGTLKAAAAETRDAAAEGLAERVAAQVV